MQLSIILPIVTLVLGWLLNELSRYFVFNYEMHGAIGKTVLNLLEIRNKLKNIQFYSQYITKTLNLPVEAPEMRLLYKKIFPSNEELYQNIQQSIISIASSNPVLAYQLKENITGLSVFDKVFLLIEGNEEGDRLFANFLASMEYQTLPLIDDSLLQLAKKHGLITYLKTKHQLNTAIKIDPEMEKTLNKFKETMESL
jgi:hypothetical protein